MGAIYRREIKSYFTSPLGYVYSAIFLVVSGVLFYYNTFQKQLANSSPADLGSYFMSLMFLMMVLIPLLTMKTFADEKKSGTEQLLLTSPVSLGSIVAAKFCAAYTVFAGSFLLSCFNLIAIRLYGSPNGRVLIGYMVGILLVGGAFIAVGIFFSSLTENQLIAAVCSIAVLFLMMMINSINNSISSPFLRSILSWLSVYSRYLNFTYGIFDISALIYYISICFAFLFLTVRVYEKRRWE